MFRHFWKSQPGNVTFEFSMMSAFMAAMLVALLQKAAIQSGMARILGYEIAWLQAKLFLALH